MYKGEFNYLHALHTDLLNILRCFTLAKSIFIDLKTFYHRHVNQTFLWVVNKLHFVILAQHIWLRVSWNSRWFINNLITTMLKRLICLNMAGLDQAAVRATCREREYLKGEQLGFVTSDRLQAAGLRKLNTLTHTQTQGLGHFSHSSCQWADKYFPHVCFAVAEPDQRRGKK